MTARIGASTGITSATARTRWPATVCRCTQTPAKADELDAAVWGHVKALLEDPAALAARFEELTRALEAKDGGRAAVQRWEAQLRRLEREEQRLVDAYQA